MSEEYSSKKEEELLGIPLSKLGAPALGIAALALGGVVYQFLKPQIEQMTADMRNRQAYAQQQQLLAAQQQQFQYQQQHQQALGNQNQQGPQEMIEQSVQEPSQGADPSVAIEQDPFQRSRRVRIPEVESDGSGSSRFNNISI